MMAMMSKITKVNTVTCENTKISLSTYSGSKTKRFSTQN